MYSSNPNFIIKIPWSVSKSLPVILNTNCLLLLASWEEIQWGIAEIFLRHVIEKTLKICPNKGVRGQLFPYF